MVLVLVVLILPSYVTKAIDFQQEIAALSSIILDFGGNNLSGE
jgi:hypothetical protein